MHVTPYCNELIGSWTQQIVKTPRGQAQLIRAPGFSEAHTQSGVPPAVGLLPSFVLSLSLSDLEFRIQALRDAGWLPSTEPDGPRLWPGRTLTVACPLPSPDLPSHHDIFTREDHVSSFSSRRPTFLPVNRSLLPSPVDVVVTNAEGKTRLPRVFVSRDAPAECHPSRVPQTGWLRRRSGLSHGCWQRSRSRRKDRPANPSITLSHKGAPGRLCWWAQGQQRPEEFLSSGGGSAPRGQGRARGRAGQTVSGGGQSLWAPSTEAPGGCPQTPLHEGARRPCPHLCCAPAGSV